MRVNVYAEEMTDRIQIISKEIEGQRFTGLRFYLELPASMIPTNDAMNLRPATPQDEEQAQQFQAPFIHHPGDDDSAAVTFWGKRDLRGIFRKALTLLANYYKEMPAGIEAIARIAHNVNAAYCQALGDNSQVSWEDAPDWQKESAISGVMFHMNNPQAGPDHSHNEWMRHKEAEGWKYGAVKDAEKKEHPCFLPYDQLPSEQKAKDYIFKAIVRAHLS